MCTGISFRITLSNGKNGVEVFTHVHSFVKEQREKYGDNCLLMDNGDILQGQPTAYYYNFIKYMYLMLRRI